MTVTDTIVAPPRPAPIPAGRGPTDAPEASDAVVAADRTAARREDNRAELKTAATAPLGESSDSRPVAGVTRPEPRWQLTPSTRMIWRGSDVLQLELGATRVVVSGMAAHVISALATDGVELEPQMLCGSGSYSPLSTGGSGMHPPSPRGAEDLSAQAALPHVLGALIRSGFLSPADVPPEAAAAEPDLSASAALLAPDLAALGARFGGRARQVIRARRVRHVSVQGTGRLPALVASLFAAAGVGHLRVADGGEVALRDAIPGGLQPGDEGHRAGLAAAAAIQRAAPGVDTTVTTRFDCDLTVLAVDAPVRSDVHTALSADGRPHLTTSVWGAGAVIGPLVVPGYTSCLGCADLHRSDRDPAWPALAAQLATASPVRAASDVAVCALAASVTVLQALAFLDGEQPAIANATLEITLPDWRLRRRSWLPHPDCPCAHTVLPRHTGSRE